MCFSKIDFVTISLFHIGTYLSVSFNIGKYCIGWPKYHHTRWFSVKFVALPLLQKIEPPFIYSKIIILLIISCICTWSCIYIQFFHIMRINSFNNTLIYDWKYCYPVCGHTITIAIFNFIYFSLLESAHWVVYLPICPQETENKIVSYKL
jgi:hypothetical protein